MPSSLQSLSLDTLGVCGYSFEEHVEMGFLSFVWTFDQIRDLLLPHRPTLRELRIRQQGPEQAALERFDLHNFNELRTLQLCTLGLPSPERACDLWLIPSLRQLSLEYSWCDSQNGVKWRLGTRDLAWLKAFARTAQDRKMSGVSGLCTIEIICDARRNEESPLLASRRREIEANCAEMRGVVEACGFEFVWRKEM